MTSAWFEFGSPWFLLLLGLIPLIWWRWLSRAGQSAVIYSSVGHLKHQGQSLRTRLRILIPILRTLAVLILVVCLARPLKGDESTKVFAEGIAIQMVVDRSGSMQAQDFYNKKGQRTDRLEVVKEVVKDFVEGDDDDLEGRPDDLVGLISFASYPDSTCPLTLDREFLMKALKETEIVKDQSESATAIGDALALGVEKIRDLENRLNLEDAKKIKSKVIILLTDGENNFGEIDPLTAADLAQTFGIKVYTIGVGTEGYAPFPAIDMFGRETLRQMEVHIDEKTLTEIAERTGGQYFRATDTDSLRNIYKIIDELEKTELHEKRFRNSKEMAVDFATFGETRFPPLLWFALAMIGLETLLANTWLRKIP